MTSIFVHFKWIASDFRFAIPLCVVSEQHTEAFELMGCCNKSYFLSANIQVQQIDLRLGHKLDVNMDLFRQQEAGALLAKVWYYRDSVGHELPLGTLKVFSIVK